jgi:hypothetical protein
VDGDEVRRTTATIRKRKKIRRMSTDLNAKIDEPHTLRAFEKEWPLSNDDKKLTKKQQEHQDVLDHFFSKMDEDVAGRTKQILE